MQVFVDESGDPGRKIDRGSSTHFVVAVVTFSDNDDAYECDQRIERLKQELGRPTGYELHFAHNSKKVRQRFLEAVTPFPFFYHVFALDKDPKKLYGSGFEVKESLYKFATRLTFENAKPYLNNATVTLDGSGDRKFRNELSTYLRRRIRDEGGRSLIRKVKIQKSDKTNLLQLADYVAGISSRYIRGTPDGRQLRQRYLASHEITLRIWPN